MRAGTENTAGIVGFGEAVHILAERGEADKKSISRLSRRLKQGLEERIPKIKFNGHPEQRISGTLSFSFLGLEAEAILLSLATKDIYVSTGSACSEDSEDVSQVRIDSLERAAPVIFQHVGDIHQQPPCRKCFICLP